MQHEDETPHELGAATHGADIHDQGDTVAGRVNDDVESDRDDELAHDTEDFARTAAVPASSATPEGTWRRTRTASSSRRSTC